MPILHEWDNSEEPMRTVLLGPVGYEDMYRHLDDVAAAHAFPRAELIDARGVEGSGPTLAELRQLAGRARDLSRDGKLGPRAIVTEGGLVSLTVCKLFTAFMTGPMRIEVFTSEAAALRWLRASRCAKSLMTQESAAANPV